jgi:hypothetical protein
VVAVAQADGRLAHAIAEERAGHGLTGYPRGLLGDLVGLDELLVVRLGR